MGMIRPKVIPAEMYGERVIAWRHYSEADEWRYQVFTSGGDEGSVYTVTADGRVVSAGHLYIVGEGVK